MNRTIDHYCRLEGDLVVEWTGESIQQIRNGILFVLATWSGQSLLALREVSSVLASLEHGLFYVANIDSLSSILQSELGQLHGRGETFVVTEGAIVYELRELSDGWEGRLKDAVSTQQPE